MVCGPIISVAPRQRPGKARCSYHEKLGQYMCICWSFKLHKFRFCYTFRIYGNGCKQEYIHTQTHVQNTVSLVSGLPGLTPNSGTKSSLHLLKQSTNKALICFKRKVEVHSARTNHNAACPSIISETMKCTRTYYYLALQIDMCTIVQEHVCYIDMFLSTRNLEGSPATLKKEECVQL